MNHFPVTKVFGALDLLKSHTIIGKGGAYMVPAGVVFSEKTYASLPADVKKVVDDAAAAWYNTAFEADKAFIALTEGIARDRGDTMTQISGADLDVWYKAIKGPIHDTWLKDAGPAGQKVYDEALKQIKASQ